MKYDFVRSTRYDNLHGNPLYNGVLTVAKLRHDAINKQVQFTSSRHIYPQYTTYFCIPELRNLYIHLYQTYLGLLSFNLDEEICIYNRHFISKNINTTVNATVKNCGNNWRQV